VGSVQGFWVVLQVVKTHPSSLHGQGMFFTCRVQGFHHKL
jgi:hypothetical protein